MCDLSLSSLAGRLNRKHALLLPVLGASFSCAQPRFIPGFDAHLPHGFCFKPPKLRREVPNLPLSYSEKFDIHQETRMCVFGALDQLSADVPLNRASPNRAFEASKLGHPACGSGISSNAN